MKQMVIGFVTAGLAFNGDTLKTRGLGGSETALLCVAREFAKRGHRVAVFCECDEPGTYDGVDYYHHSTFTRICSVVRWDVLIASRWMEFLSTPSFAGLRILWLHDTMTNKARLWNNVWQTDEIFLLSDFHIADYTEAGSEEDVLALKVAEFREHMWKTSNGVDMATVEANRRPKVPGKIIYTSRPERGLHYLLQAVFPTLLKEFPDLKLHYANYSLQGMQVPPQVAQIIALSEHLAKQMPGKVVDMGHLTKEQLYQEISSAELLLYPTGFSEISCITAMEAAACGTPIVSTNDFALKETVSSGRTGFLINGKPDDGEVYFAKFNRKALMLLRDDKRREAMAKAGPEWIEEQGYTWAAVAESWEKHFIELMESRFRTRGPAVINELIRNHDLVMASELAAQTGDDQREIDINYMIGAAREYDIPTTDIGVKAVFKEAMPRFKKLAQFLATTNVDPQIMWDFACGDSSFGLYMAKASEKVEAYVIDQDEDTVDRVLRYANMDQVALGDRVIGRVADSLSQLDNDITPKPDTIFFGDYLDKLEEPWEALREALLLCKPGGWVIFTTRAGTNTATLPTEYDRIWNLEQQDFYEMFGRDFSGQLNFFEEGLSPGGDLFGHWLCWIPVPTEAFEIHPLTAERRSRVTRPYESLTCSMIGRDVEDWVTMCLKQLLPICDKINIVLDDRTEDHTEDAIAWLDPAKKISITRHAFEDFSRQRNVSVDKNVTDWTLWVDFDEKMTEPLRLRRYLRSTMFEGFSLKQCHLMLDVHGTSDIPVRLLRNRPEYRFVGCIHEHCEDTSKGYDSPINPVLLIPDVELAHYGYLNEKARRKKCSNRNMALLQKDIEENGKKGRSLTWVLVMRDYLNIIKWKIDKDGAAGLKQGSEEHKLCEATISTFLEKFPDPKHRHYGLAFPMFQEALKIMGCCGIPVGDRKKPPFSVALGLSGSFGGDARDDVKAKVSWFLDEVDYLEFIERQSKMMLGKLGVVGAQHYADDLAKPTEVQFNYSEKTPELLSAGVDAIHTTTGKLQ